MAWQSPSMVGGNNGVGGGGGDGGHSSGAQAQGTEYTLQGVMRFLQTEWHRHERDRNAWEIERAEMKGRIAKLEGTARKHKKMEESLSRHVKMLEKALKKERAQNQSEQQAEKDDTAQEAAKSEAVNNVVTKPVAKHQNSFLDVDMDSKNQFREDPQRNKSRIYLEKSLSELTYLLIAPSRPPVSQLSQYSSNDLSRQQEFNPEQQQQQGLEDVYLPQHQREFNHVQESQSSEFPSDEQSLQAEGLPDNTGHGSASQLHPSLNQDVGDQDLASPNLEASFTEDPISSQSLGGGLQSSSEDVVEKVTHSYDSFGRPITRQQEDVDAEPRAVAGEDQVLDHDGWNFEDSVAPAPEVPTHRRADTDAFPNASNPPNKSPSPGGRRKGSMSRRRSADQHELNRVSSPTQSQGQSESSSFKVRFALRGHLDVVRAVIFTGGGTPSEPEICTAGDDGMIKRWIIPASYSSFGPQGGGAGKDLDIQSYFTHRGHTGAVTSLSTCPSSANFSTGGRALGDGWIFSGGSDATIRVWERGRVDPKASLDGHTDAIWTVCVLPSTCANVFRDRSNDFGGSDRILLASGSADRTVKIWAVSAPPQLTSPQTGSRRGVGGSRRHSVTSGSSFPSSPQPSTATSTPFEYSLVHTIERPDITASPTCIAPLSLTGDSFVVSYQDAAVIIFDTRTGEEVVGMASLETYEGTPDAGVNAVTATTIALDSASAPDSKRGITEDEGVGHGATGSSGGVEGIVISGHEDRYIRFFDANSGQCTYSMLAHPAPIASLSLSPDGRQLVSAGHDASLRFWSLEKRSCSQDITSHRLMRGEGVCSVVWSQDSRWVVSGGGDGVVKVFSR